jgi:endonuclease/exonuclease/phosphatase (EEP) superfamily protein YafD
MSQMQNASQVVRSRSHLSRILTRVTSSFVAAATVVVVVLSLAAFGARQWWRFELACHFRWHYLWLLLVAAVYLAVVRRRILAGMAVAVAFLNLALVVPIYVPRADNDAATGQALRVVSCNVLSRNPHREEVMGFLREERADLVLLMEISPAWATALESLSDQYPYRHVVPRTDNFGIAVLSQKPWRTIETIELGTAGVPSVVAEFGDGDSGFLFIGTHPLPPGSATMAAERNEQLRAVSEYVVAKRTTTILVGDLNVTSYSPYFGDLLMLTGLRDTRQGFGIQASWGTPLIEIPIDHCLVSPGVAVVDRRVGGHMGSDHRPVIVDLRMIEK